MLEALATPALLEQNWVKSTIVNKIICLYPEESWKQDNLVFAAFQVRLIVVNKLVTHHERDVWWVKNSHKWFDMFQCNTPEEYLKVQCDFLFLASLISISRQAFPLWYWSCSIASCNCVTL